MTLRSKTLRNKIVLARSRRAGVSLVEMVVVISITSAILGMIAVLWGSLLLAAKRQSSLAVEQRAIVVLAEQFRRDVRNAVSYELRGEELVGNATPRATFALDGESSVKYAHLEFGVTRETSGDVDGRERYRLPHGSTVTWASTAEDNQGLTMRIDVANSNQLDEARHSLLVKAYVGNGNQDRNQEAAP